MNRDPNSINVEFSDTQSHLSADHTALADLARRVLRAEGIERATISIALVDDATIREANRRHLDHDWPTDVISFPLSEPGDPVLEGELILSAEMAATTARQAGTDPRAELALYLVHGLLHLCGYDDETVAEAAVMRRREAELLAEAGLPNTFSMTGPADAGQGGAT
ncbi:MAG: rRNA maturation RNase YbeY [Isosphaeraceae bacterium]|nr:rRNA maturation RNase YbeY [Isosphaeraceae bacterium]